MEMVPYIAFSLENGCLQFKRVCHAREVASRFFFNIIGVTNAAFGSSSIQTQAPPLSISASKGINLYFPLNVPLTRSRTRITNRDMKMFKQFFPLVILLAILTNPAVAQSDQGFTITPDPNYPEVFVASAPERIPILRDDMPWDVGLAYIVLDTICKTYTREQIAQGLTELSDDSLLIAWNLLHRAIDYDDFLIRLFDIYIRHHRPADYKSDFGETLLLLNREYGFRFRGIPREDILVGAPNVRIPDELIWFASGIYLVRCMNLDRRPVGYDPMYYGPDCPDSVYWADVEVQQIYKGWRYYSNCDRDEYELSEQTGCIRLTWHASSCDSAQWARKALLPGKDYLIFTDIGFGEGNDYENEQSWAWVIRTAKRFEVSGGDVLDPEKYFRQSDSVPLSEIETLIENALNELTGR